MFPSIFIRCVSPITSYYCGRVCLTDVAVLMDKGIIIGAEHESGTGATLPFVTFRHATSVS